MTDLGSKNSSRGHAHYEWLDQVRGAIIIFLVVSTAASVLSGGSIEHLRPVVSPPFFAHGSHFVDAHPKMTTMVDHGAQMFVFLLGFVAYGAFSRRLARRGAWVYALRRVLALLAISIVLGGAGPLVGAGFNWAEALYEGTFAKLAIASLAAYLGIRFVPNPRHRVWIAVFLMAIHMVLWDHLRQHPVAQLAWIGRLKLPWGAWNTAAIALIATAFGQWVYTHPKGVDEGMRTHLFRGTVWMFVAYFVTSWLQYSEHFRLTTPHAIGGMLHAQCLLLIMFAFDRAGMHFPVLSALGRNLLIMFLVGGIGTFVHVEILKIFMHRDIMAAFPLGTFLIACFLPYVVTISLGLFLDRKGIYIRV